MSLSTIKRASTIQRACLCRYDRFGRFPLRHSCRFLTWSDLQGGILGASKVRGKVEREQNKRLPAAVQVRHGCRAFQPKWQIWCPEGGCIGTCIPAEDTEYAGVLRAICCKAWSNIMLNLKNGNLLHKRCTLCCKLPMWSNLWHSSRRNTSLPNDDRVLLTALLA